MYMRHSTKQGTSGTGVFEIWTIKVDLRIVGVIFIQVIFPREFSPACYFGQAPSLVCESFCLTFHLS